MILHVDMDAFYASVEERDDPALAGRPVIVGGTPEGRGVVSAANYLAREHGVHSAMPAARARRLCPHAAFIRPRMECYAAESARVRAVLERYTPEVEPIALDEAFLDVTASESLFGPAPGIARRIKRDVAAATGLVASVGVAASKFVAKLACERDKPDGLVVVEPGSEQAFLDPLPVARLWGVGPVAAEALQRAGIATVADLRARGEAHLRARFGRTGAHLWRLAHGVDERPVVPDHRARSISHETTFAVDVAEAGAQRAWVGDLAAQVAGRLRRAGLVARTVFVKLRYADFRTVSRTRSLAAPTDLSREIRAAALRGLAAARGDAHGALRLLGVGVSGLERAGPRQGHLFEEQRRERERRLDRVVDAVGARYGRGVLRRGVRPPRVR